MPILCQKSRIKMLKYKFAKKWSIKHIKGAVYNGKSFTKGKLSFCYQEIMSIMTMPQLDYAIAIVLKSAISFIPALYKILS